MKTVLSFWESTGVRRTPGQQPAGTARKTSMPQIKIGPKDTGHSLGHTVSPTRCHMLPTSPISREASRKLHSPPYQEVQGHRGWTQLHTQPTALSRTKATKAGSTPEENNQSVSLGLLTICTFMNKDNQSYLIYKQTRLSPNSPQRAKETQLPSRQEPAAFNRQSRMMRLILPTCSHINIASVHPMTMWIYPTLTLNNKPNPKT